MFGDVPTSRTVLEGLLDLDADIVVTVGHNIDPATVDVGRSNLMVRQFIPQGAVLGRCRLVVNHGGSGSVLGPLHYGVPLIIVPMERTNSRTLSVLPQLRSHRSSIPPISRPRAIGEHCRGLLEDVTRRRKALAVRDEIAVMPAAAEVVPVLEELVLSKA